MENIKPDLSHEISMKIINEVGKIVTYFEVDVQEQIKLRNKIEGLLNNYEITSKCTAITKGDILEKAFLFLASRKLEGMCSSTRYNYTLLFKKMDKYFSKPIIFITTMDLRMFLASEYKDNQPNSLNDKINKIRSFFGWLQDEGYITMNSSKNLKPTKIPYRKRTPIPDMEMERLKESCDNSRDKALIELMSSSGLRVSEISFAKLSDVNWNNNSLTIIGKGNKERMVYFSTRAKLLIQNYIEDREAKGIYSDYIFTASKFPFNNLGRRSIERDVKRIADAACIHSNIIPHRFRTSYICKGVNGNMNLSAIQKLVGHESASTTEKYLTLSTDFIKHEYKKIAL